MVGDRRSGFVETICKVLVRNLLTDSLGGGAGRGPDELSERSESFSTGGGGVVDSSDPKDSS